MLLGSAARRISPLASALVACQLANVAWQHWRSLGGDERARLQSLLRQSRGRPANLSRAQRQELRGLVRALELPRLVRESAASVAGAGALRRSR